MPAIVKPAVIGSCLLMSAILGGDIVRVLRRGGR